MRPAYQGPDVPNTRPWNPDLYAGWRRSIEQFRVVQGVRPALEHVAERAWVDHFAANEDPVSAVVNELAKVDS